MTMFARSRRAFLAQAGLAAGAALLALAGCGKREPGGEAAAGSAGGTAARPGPPCDDLAGLTAAQVQVRGNYEYVEQASEPELACRRCEFYKPAPAGAFCGGCTLFAGPVNPDGSCNTFSEA